MEKGLKVMKRWGKAEARVIGGVGEEEEEEEEQHDY